MHLTAVSGLPRAGSQPYDVLALTVITKSLHYLQTPTDQLLDAKLILRTPSISSSSLSGSVYRLPPPQWAGGHEHSQPNRTPAPSSLLHRALRSREVSAGTAEQAWDKDWARTPPSGTLMTSFSLSTARFTLSTW